MISPAAAAKATTSHCRRNSAIASPMRKPVSSSLIGSLAAKSWGFRIGGERRSTRHPGAMAHGRAKARPRTRRR